MCQICADKKSLTKDVLRSLTQALIYCRLDYCNGQNNRHSDKTAAIGTEYRSLFSVWSTTSEPHHSSPTQPPLTSGAAECCQLYGNVSTALLIHIFRNSALSWKRCPHLQSASVECNQLARVQTLISQQSITLYGLQCETVCHLSHVTITLSVQAVAEQLSVWTMLNIIQFVYGISGTVYKGLHT